VFIVFPNHFENRFADDCLKLQIACSNKTLHDFIFNSQKKTHLNKWVSNCSVSLRLGSKVHIPFGAIGKSPVYSATQIKVI